MKVSSFSFCVSCVSTCLAIRHILIKERADVHSREPSKHGAASSIDIAVLIGKMSTKQLSMAGTRWTTQEPIHAYLSGDRLVIVVIRLQAAQAGVRILSEARDFSLFRNVQIGFEAHYASY